MDTRELGELAVCLSAFGEGTVSVSELYGPGRFTERASAFDMQPGMAYDLRTGFDFDQEADRHRARVNIDREKALLLVGSPMCAPFSVLQQLNLKNPRLEDAVRRGLQHLYFCIGQDYKHIEEGNSRYHLLS